MKTDTKTNTMKTKTDVSAWDFVEKYYPNYYSCDLIARNDDLCKILHDECQEGDDSERLLNEEYNGDRENPQILADFNQSIVDIYEASIEAFLEKQNSSEA